MSGTEESPPDRRVQIKPQHGYGGGYYFYMNRKIINRKQYNQYFTPMRVARFMMKILKKINPCLVSHSSSFIDPACGDGAFLKAALNENITTPPFCYGIDKDEMLKASWITSGLSSLLKNNIIVSDALFTDIPTTFRISAGNPPFGTIPLESSDIERLQSFNIFRDFLKKRKLKNPPPSFPIEILFLEKFIQLTEPGGMIAIVLPEGISANSKMDYVRDFIEDKCFINAIVSPKSGIFTGEGTGAMTCLLFLTRKGTVATEKLSCEEEEKSSKVLMAAPVSIDLSGGNEDDLSRIIDDYPDFQNCDNHSPAWWIPYPSIKGSRWDPGFHSPEYTHYMQKLRQGRFPLISLSDLLPEDRIFTANKGVQKPAVSSDRVQYITSRQITETGIDLTLHDLWVDRNGSCNPERTRIRKDDILFVRSGDGCIGRSVVAGEECEGSNIRSEIYILRPDPQVINPFYLTLFFNMFKVPHKKHGVNFQLKRLLSGVGTPNLSKNEILSVMVPMIPITIQAELEIEYRRIRAKNNAYVKEKMRQNTGRNEVDSTAENIKPADMYVEIVEEMKSLLRRTAEAMRVSIKTGM